MHESIAVVDDEADLVDFFSDALKMNKYEVSTFTDSLLAYEHITQNPIKYSLLIADYQMPKMNGLFLATKLLEIHQNLKVIIMSCSWELEYAPQFRFIRKPVSLQKFVKIVYETIFSPLPYIKNK